jgi:GT2 family glycosyltransferase
MYSAVHIIIPFFKGGQFIQPCVESLLQQTVPTQVWIVDNDPDGLSSGFKAPNIKVIKTRSGIGYGRAANVGVSHAVADGAQVIIVANQDTLFAEDAVEKLSGQLPGDSIDVITPMLYTYDFEAISGFFRKVVLDRTDYPEDELKGRVRPIYESKTAYGACLCFHRSVWKDVGLFDPLYYMYGEDSDLFDRVRECGGKVFFSTESRVAHLHTHVSGSRSQRNQAEFWRNSSRRIHAIRFDRPGLSRQIAVTARSALKYILKGRFADAVMLVKAHYGFSRNKEMIQSTEPDVIVERIRQFIAEDSAAQEDVR